MRLSGPADLPVLSSSRTGRRPALGLGAVSEAGFRSTALVNAP